MPSQSCRSFFFMRALRCSAADLSASTCSSSFPAIYNVALIVSEIEGGTFSFTDFYERRIRRIFPALFVVMGFSAAFGWFVMAPEYTDQQLGQSIIATTLFVSNYLFWSQTGYFDTPAMEKPRCTLGCSRSKSNSTSHFHCISSLPRASFRDGIADTILAALASFSLSIWMVRRTPGAAFYFGPPRAWELLIGSLLAIGFAKYPATERVRNAVAALGILLIAAAVVGYSKDTRFPGIAALPPTIGAAFLIWSGTLEAQWSVGCYPRAHSFLSARFPLPLFVALQSPCICQLSQHQGAGRGRNRHSRACLLRPCGSLVEIYRAACTPAALAKSGPAEAFRGCSGSDVLFVAHSVVGRIREGLPSRLAPDRLEFAARDEFAGGREKCRIEPLELEICSLGSDGRTRSPTLAIPMPTPCARPSMKSRRRTVCSDARRSRRLCSAARRGT